MIAITLVEAVSQIIGKQVSEEFAKQYVFNNYMEFRMFTRHEDKVIAESKRLLRTRAGKREELRKMYSKN